MKTSPTREGKSIGHRVLNVLIFIFSAILVIEAIAVAYILFEADRLEKRENELRGITHQHMSMAFIPSESVSSINFLPKGRA